jgi:hypothetical protein
MAAQCQLTMMEQGSKHTFQLKCAGQKRTSMKFRRTMSVLSNVSWKFKVEEHILEWNKHHVKQAHETPFFNYCLVGLTNDAADNLTF